MRGSYTMFHEKGCVICPKPQRIRVLSQLLGRPLRCHLSEQGEGSDSKGGAEVLDMIFRECYGEEVANEVASSPPYCVGSPPVRTANPLIQDSQFVYERHTSPILSSSSASSGLSPPRKAGCVRMKFGLNPAAVRAEGFGCHIPAVS